MEKDGKKDIYKIYTIGIEGVDFSLLQSLFFIFSVSIYLKNI